MAATIAAAIVTFLGTSGVVPASLFGALATLYIGAVGLLTRRLIRTRYYDFRIALTGQPEAGKTVFATLLYEHLMNGNDPSYEFTAESKSAIATYQAIRGITEDRWPASTATGSVLQRDGVLRHGRTVVDIEIGDSAGQHWLQLAAPSETEADALQGPAADYLQWVLSAQALAHVIPADRMLQGAFEATLRSDIKDLRLASQLMRSVSRSSYRRVPILVVISKMDLVPVPLVAREMMRTFTAQEALLLESTALLRDAGFLDPDLLVVIHEELSRDFQSVTFTYSSAEVVKRFRPPGSFPPRDIPEWIVTHAAMSR